MSKEDNYKRVKEWRKANRVKYNDYQREYMRKRRGLVTEKKEGEKCGGS